MGPKQSKPSVCFNFFLSKGQITFPLEKEEMFFFLCVTVNGLLQGVFHFAVYIF